MDYINSEWNFAYNEASPAYEQTREVQFNTNCTHDKNNFFCNDLPMDYNKDAMINSKITNEKMYGFIFKFSNNAPNYTVRGDFRHNQ
jgi:hypothetical protein